jgi:hypothetical protein
MKNSIGIVLLLVLFITGASAAKGDRAKRFEAKKSHILENIKSRISLNEDFSKCVEATSKHKDISKCKKSFKQGKKALKKRNKAYRAKMKANKK